MTAIIQTAVDMLWATEKIQIERTTPCPPSWTSLFLQNEDHLHRPTVSRSWFHLICSFSTTSDTQPLVFLLNHLCFFSSSWLSCILQVSMDESGPSTPVWFCKSELDAPSVLLRNPVTPLAWYVSHLIFSSTHSVRANLFTVLLQYLVLKCLMSTALCGRNEILSIIYY